MSRLPDLYLEAAELDEAGREALLERVAHDDPALAAELRLMLARPESVASPIDRPPPLPGDLETAPPPERVGPFRIVRELGRGGMGRVFLAEQETPDFTRCVALKLIHRPGPDVVRRFRDEVRILASLEHPWIARFLDGGRSPEGIWFLALEYVEGEDIVSHARERELDVDARVRLFAAVAEAVAYAHERGVVHRDLKPGNVLVGRDGRPRLLDFGISKLLDPEGSPDPTTSVDRILTPAYASPEQLAGRPATPASDVYSLGVVLYELLAGRRPTHPSDAETEWAGPAPPSSVARRRSTRSSTSSARRSRRSAAAPRISTALDAICLEALRQAPAERYASAAELLEDLRRYLDGEPIEARPAGRSFGIGRSRGQRGRRLAIVAAGLALVAALVVLGALAWVDLPRLEPATPAASAPVRSGAFPFDPVNPPPPEEMARRFAAAPDDVEAGAALALSLEKAGRTDEARFVIGRLRQIPGKESDPLIDFADGRIANDRGEHQRALVFYTRARDQAVAEGRSDLLGTIRSARGRVLSQLGERDAARDELERARADCERAGDDVALYRTLNDLAIEYLQRGEMARGEETLEAAVAAARRAGLEPLIALGNLALVKFDRGRPDAAEALVREVIALRRSSSPDGALASNAAGHSLIVLALILGDLGRPEEAEPVLEEALTVLRDAGTENRADAVLLRALVDLEAGRLDRLEPAIGELEGAAHADLRRRPLGWAHSLRARRAAVLGDLDGARRHFAEACRLLLLEGDRDEAALVRVAWAEAETSFGSPESAGRILDEALATLDQAEVMNAGYFAEALRARLDSDAGRPEAARRRLAGLGEDMARSPSLSRRLAFLRARARLAATEGRNETARTDLEAAVAAARSAQRKLEELTLTLDLAAVAADDETAARLAFEVEREASRLGLLALAGRADRLASALVGIGDRLVD